jgi:hypothetical protein
MDSKNLLIVGAVGVGGYLAYQWYYGPGGYADQQACATLGMTAAQLQAIAANVITGAAAGGVTPAAYIAANPSTANPALLACARVAIAQYPTAAASSTTAAATTSTVATPAATPAAPVTPTPVTPAAPSALDTMYASLKNQAASDSFFTGSGDARTGSVDHWNYYLAQLVPAGVTIPGGLFSNVAGDDPNNLTAAQYWAVMAPWLASNAGLSGLGMYGGLGAIVRAYRGR